MAWSRGGHPLKAGIACVLKRDTILNRRTLRLTSPQVFIEAGKDLPEIAGPIAVIELGQQDLVPRILSCAWRAGQAKDVGFVGNPGSCARLRRSPAPLLLPPPHHHPRSPP